MKASAAIQTAMEAAARLDFAEAIRLLKPVAESGNAEAMFQLGRLAFTECEAVSGKESFSWIKRAAEEGHAAAMYTLATFPEFMAEAFRSPLTAEQSWEFVLKSAELCYVDAQYEAAAALATGEWRDSDVVSIDLVAAFQWYEKASAQGHAEAQFNLACMLLEGEGCAVDREGALKWLQKASASGHAQSRRLLPQLLS